MRNYFFAVVVLSIFCSAGSTSSKSVIDENKYDDIIMYYSFRYQMDPFLIKAVIKIESGFDPKKVSRKNAKGLMQLMQSIIEVHCVKNPFDPVENICIGSRHLSILLSYYRGDIDKTLAAYNAGTGAVKKYKGCPPYRETKEFVKNVKKVCQIYKCNNFIARKRVYSFTDSKGHMYFFGE